MTKKPAFLLFFSLVFAATCFSRLEQWPVTRKPTLTLAQAELVGDKTVEGKYKDFFCIGARFASLGGAEQEWELAYTNAKGERKWVIVDGNGKAELLDYSRPL